MKKRLPTFLVVLMGLLVSVSLSGCSKPQREIGVSAAPPLEGMVFIPAGKFQMGSINAKPTDYDQPYPGHTVYVDAFYMDKTEVTNAQFQEFLIKNPRWQKGRIDTRFADTYYLNHWNGNSYPSGSGNHPVMYVSWYAAMAYAEWTGKRLPTEAEWEYAARGGLVGNNYPHGNTIMPRDANYSRRNIRGGTTAVGQYPANAYGLYDMAGNVWEWCLDEYDRDLYLTFPRKGVARNPLSGATSVEGLMNNFRSVNSPRVIHGGAWDQAPLNVRVVTHTKHLPRFTNVTLGFRCVRDISP